MASENPVLVTAEPIDQPIVGQKRPLTPELSPKAQSSRPKLGTKDSSGGKQNREISSASYDYCSGLSTSLVDVLENTAVASNAEPANSLNAASITQQHVRIHPKSHTQISNDVYVDLVQEMMYGDGGLVAASKAARMNFDQITAMGYLLNPLRKVSVMEKWNPFEVAMFEAAISLYGKDFHIIHKAVQTKRTEEVIAFFYEWKKTGHYLQWKQSYKAEQPDEVDED